MSPNDNQSQKYACNVFKSSAVAKGGDQRLQPEAPREEENSLTNKERERESQGDRKRSEAE